MPDSTSDKRRGWAWRSCRPSKGFCFVFFPSEYWEATGGFSEEIVFRYCAEQKTPDIKWNVPRTPCLWFGRRAELCHQG